MVIPAYRHSRHAIASGEHLRQGVSSYQMVIPAYRHSRHAIASGEHLRQGVSSYQMVIPAYWHSRHAIASGGWHNCAMFLVAVTFNSSARSGLLSQVSAFVSATVWTTISGWYRENTFSIAYLSETSSVSYQYPSVCLRRAGPFDVATNE